MQQFNMDGMIQKMSRMSLVNRILKGLLIAQIVYAVLPIPFIELLKLEWGGDIVVIFFYYLYFFIAGIIAVVALITFLVGLVRKSGNIANKYIVLFIVAVYILNSLRVWNVLAKAWS